MTTWDDLKQRVELIHADTCTQLRAQFPSLWSHSEVWGNDVFPLSGSLTLNLTGGSRDDDVIAATRFLVVPDGLEFECDISREDGHVLADGPSKHSKTAGLSEIEWAKSCVEAYESFLSGTMYVLSDELPRLNQ